MSAPPARNRIGFWILIALLAVTGVSMAFIAVFGQFDSAAFSLIWRVFLADVYLICSFAAQHTWLRRTAWIATAVTFVIGVVSAFWEYTPYYRPYQWNEHEVIGDPSTGWDPLQGIEESVEYAAHMIVVGVLLLGLVSLAYKWIRRERVLRTIYVATFITGVAAMLTGAVVIVGDGRFWDSQSGWEEAALACMILAFTGAAIVTIGAFVQRKATLQKGQHGTAALPAGVTVASGLPSEELRALVREYVEEYLDERNKR